MRIAFVVNPRAGRGRGAVLARELPAMVAARGLQADILATDEPGHAVELARGAAASHDAVVAVGGDGTAHEVVNGVAESDAAFGLLPMGTGNDLALALGVPGDPGAALDLLASGAERRIDLARFDDDRSPVRWFANSLGLGFEAQVTIESRKVKLLRGFPVYLWAVARALGGLRCPDLRITADGRVFEGRRLLLCIGNGPRVGGGFWLTPDARNDDGWLDLCIVEAMGRGNVMRRLPRALKGSHTGESWATMLRAREIRIESRDGFPFHADGEVVDTGRNRLAVTIVPQALKVIAPRP
jgi:YegS/Rv2252/BmrU family lipid kinase